MKFRRSLTAGGALVAATALSLGLAPQASAADHVMYTDDSGRAGGSLSFTRDGDISTLCDRQADGSAVAMRVHGAYTYTLSSGNGTCQTLRPSVNKKYDLKEGKTYKFEICLVKNGRYDYCDEAYWKA